MMWNELFSRGLTGVGWPRLFRTVAWLALTVRLVLTVTWLGMTKQRLQHDLSDWCRLEWLNKDWSMTWVTGRDWNDRSDWIQYMNVIMPVYVIVYTDWSERDSLRSFTKYANKRRVLFPNICKMILIFWIKRFIGCSFEVTQSYALGNLTVN